MSRALFFIFWDEAGRYLVKNQNNSINSKQSTQKAASIWGTVNEMSSILLAWLTRTKWQAYIALHNNNPLMAALQACSRVLYGIFRWKGYTEVSLHLLCLVNCLLQRRKNSFSVSTSWAENPQHFHTMLQACAARWAACCCSSALLQPVDTYSLGKAASDGDFSFLISGESSTNKVISGYTELYK